MDFTSAKDAAAAVRLFGELMRETAPLSARYVDEQRRRLESTASNRYPDRALTRGKVRREQRRLEAIERAKQRADYVPFVPRSPLEQLVLQLGGELISERVL